MAGMGTVTTFEWRGRRRGEDVAVTGPRVMTRVARWAGVAAAGVLAGATLAHAADSSAYAQLLAAHVKPGTINGIRLNAVDYRAIGRDSNYAKALQEIATARPEQLRSQEERLVFWINAYNLLAIKAVLDQYPAKSIKDGGSLFQSIWKKKVGTVAGKRETRRRWRSGCGAPGSLSAGCRSRCHRARTPCRPRFRPSSSRWTGRGFPHL